MAQADATHGGCAEDEGRVNRPSSTDAVRSMFDAIAPTYDLLNMVLSLGLHRLWERKLVGCLTPAPGASSLDLCSGTGALVPRLAKRFSQVVAADISPQMLAVGRRRHASITNCSWVEADAQALPFADASFDAVTISYGVRNLPDPSRGLREAARVCKPGAELAILEFGQPSNPVWRWLFSLYGRFVIPFVGGLLSGRRSAYQYLPRTAAHFPCGESFEALLRQAGWTPELTVSLCGGVAFLYKARKG